MHYEIAYMTFMGIIYCKATVPDLSNSQGQLDVWAFTQLVGHSCMGTIVRFNSICGSLGITKTPGHCVALNIFNALIHDEHVRDHTEAQGYINIAFIYNGDRTPVTIHYMKLWNTYHPIRIHASVAI